MMKDEGWVREWLLLEVVNYNFLLYNWCYGSI